MSMLVYFKSDGNTLVQCLDLTKRPSSKVLFNIKKAKLFISNKKSSEKVDYLQTQLLGIFQYAFLLSVVPTPSFISYIFIYLLLRTIFADFCF